MKKYIVLRQITAVKTFIKYDLKKVLKDSAGM